MDWRSNNFFLHDADGVEPGNKTILKNFDGFLDAYASYGQNTVSLTCSAPVGPRQCGDSRDVWQHPSAVAVAPVTRNLEKLTDLMTDRSPKGRRLLRRPPLSPVSAAAWPRVRRDCVRKAARSAIGVQFLLTPMAGVRGSSVNRIWILAAGPTPSTMSNDPPFRRAHRICVPNLSAAPSFGVHRGVVSRGLLGRSEPVEGKRLDNSIQNEL